ncbi:MAG: ferrous iron transport protein B [Halanaerobiales bacterium]
MECHNLSSININDESDKLVIVGNPNVGKSIFFNYFTEKYVTVSNYPGTTLDISHGKYMKNEKEFQVIDTPGVYGVSSFNDEEKVARDIILSADIILNVVDAVHLERDLFLTQQLIDMEIPVIVALNMMDEARQNNLDIDVVKLEKELGVPVIPTVAIKKRGFQELERAIDKSSTGNSFLDKSEEISNKIELMQTNYSISRPEALMIMEGDPYISSQNKLQPKKYREKIYKKRRERVNEIIDRVISYHQSSGKVKNTLGRLMVNPLTGIPMLLLVLYLTYQFVGVFIAQTVVGFTEEIFMAEYYVPLIKRLVSTFANPSSIIGDILIGEFGLLTMTVSYTFGLLLPLIVGFYLFLSLLEDSGYLPRIATLVDRLLTFLGLNGRAVIPMILGFGCVTMATITTRLLGTKRERIIAIFLLGLAIPCSAQLGVIAGLIAPLGFKCFMIYVVTIFLIYVLSGTILNKVLPGKSTDLLIDLPPLRFPAIKNVLQKTYMKSKAFIKEAGPVFALGSLVITLMKRFQILEFIQEMITPVTESWLKLPAQSATAFIMGIIRRDFGAAGLNSLSLTADQTIVSLIVITLFVPCIASMIIMVKESNWKEALAIWTGSWAISIVTGGVIARLITYF